LRPVEGPLQMLNATVWRRQHNLRINSETEHLALD
jgi:hypothetical protein